MKKFFILFISLLNFHNAQTNSNVFTDAGDAAKLVIAKQKLYGGQTIAALNAFRDIEKRNSENSTIKFYIGYSYYLLLQFDKSMESLEKAVQLNKSLKPETHLLLGKIYLKKEEVDKAEKEFLTFKNSDKSSREIDENVDVLIQHCKNARDYIQKPISVQISNMGADINSKYDDKNPCITANGRQLVFTTRRPETTNSPMDEEGDGRYFEDIYSSSMDSIGNFLKAASIGNQINTLAHDACTSISPDGTQLFVYKNDVNNKDSRGGAVFTSKYQNGKWKAPSPLPKPINSSYWEGGACLSPDGSKLFFTSERKGGFGGSDIWMVERIGKKNWGSPVNLGSTVNTQFDEAGMFLAPDGKTLFFCSNNPNSMGGYDIFKTVYENNTWSAPKNLGYPINTPAKEGQLTLSADAKFAYLSSDRKGGYGESDLYRVDLKELAILEKDGIKRNDNNLSIFKGVIREGNNSNGLMEVEIIVKDNSNGVLATSTTGESGEFFFTLRGGDYTIQLKKKGYKESTEKINLGVSKDEIITLEREFLMAK